MRSRRCAPICRRWSSRTAPSWRRGSTPFVVDQRLQIAVLTDFCNECGNCVTACPTSGRPYLDKPRLYLDRADFEAQASNAFMLLGGGVIEARFDGATHRLSARRRHPRRPVRVCRAALPGLARRRHLRPGRGDAGRGRRGRAPIAGAGRRDGEILAGVTGSLPHIPTAASGGSRINHPSYVE